jgi:hypothetical protein
MTPGVNVMKLFSVSFVVRKSKLINKYFPSTLRHLAKSQLVECHLSGTVMVD